MVSKNSRTQLLNSFAPLRLCARFFLLLSILSTGPLLRAQENATDPLTVARAAVEAKDFAAARTAYERLYETQPTDPAVYAEYLALLLQTADYKTAGRIAERAARSNPASPLPLVDLGRVEAAQGRTKKAEEHFENAVALLTGDDLLTTSLAAAFTAAGRADYTLKTYERAREILRAPYVYTGPLARLYAAAGDLDKATQALLDGGPVQHGGIEETKASFLEIVGDDARKQTAVTRAIIKRINAQPENFFLAELLTWMYTQRGDWEGALIQVQALDERGQEGGRRLMGFAYTAARERQWDVALKSLDAVLEKGRSHPAYAAARAQRLQVGLQKLRDADTVDRAYAQTLKSEFATAFADAPELYATEAARDWAMVETQYAGDVQKGIGVLEKTLADPALPRGQAGLAKLQLGDYYVLQGKVWDASLLYSQVDKDFREDALGEDARFRNGKLAYYRGDFDWAQGQLSVLKASTSELIANDALYLSVLMTENIPPDSNLVPLRRYAAADLLLFQNKDAEAAALLDSVARAFPEHPLQDDILMLRAQLAAKHRDYTGAIALLNTLVEKHGEDVLADDAVFRIAELYATGMKDAARAREFYEKLVVDYPGSTYVQRARARIAAMNGTGGDCATC